MPDDRPFRPPSRDRFGGDRPAPRSFGDRPPPRGDRFGSDRPGPRSGGFTPRPPGPPRPPFVPRPPFAAPAEGQASVRLKDGDREVEVHGPASFCRQLLDDLPTLMTRLRGEGRAGALSIALPAPRPQVPVAPRAEPHDAEVDAAVGHELEPVLPEIGDHHHDTGTVDLLAPAAEPDDGAPEPPPTPRRGPGRPRRQPPVEAAPENGSSALEGLVHAMMREAATPIGIAEIRRRLPEEISGQAVRRLLERDRAVVNVGGKPAAYRLR